MKELIKALILGQWAYGFGNWPSKRKLGFWKQRYDLSTWVVFDIGPLWVQCHY